MIDLLPHWLDICRGEEERERERETTAYIHSQKDPFHTPLAELIISWPVVVVFTGRNQSHTFSSLLHAHSIHTRVYTAGDSAKYPTHSSLTWCVCVCVWKRGKQHTLWTHKTLPLRVNTEWKKHLVDLLLHICTGWLDVKKKAASRQTHKMYTCILTTFHSVCMCIYVYMYYSSKVYSSSP